MLEKVVIQRASKLLFCDIIIAMVPYNLVMRSPNSFSRLKRLEPAKQGSISRRTPRN